jgi:hypothetical protein
VREVHELYRGALVQHLERQPACSHAEQGRAGQAAWAILSNMPVTE